MNIRENPVETLTLPNNLELKIQETCGGPLVRGSDDGNSRVLDS